MTSDAIRLKNRKARIWNRYVATKTRYDREKYIYCRNTLRTLTSRIVKSNPKIFWKYAKSRLKTKPSIPSLSRPNGIKATSSKDKAETLNEYFSSIFTLQVLHDIPAAPTYLVDVISTIDTTPDIVREKLKSLNPNKSPGQDNLHPYSLRELFDSISIPLSILFVKSLRGAHKSWLKAVITAIHKNGIRSSPENYRPISITSVVSKIMKSILRDAIVTHMKQNLLNDH